jgi:hypothetical protein
MSHYKDLNKISNLSEGKEYHKVTRLSKVFVKFIVRDL